MDYTQYLNTMQSMIDQNNQWSAQQAERQMQFQENMSNTAHQREVADLVAAGLNPVLSAHGQGASTPNGAMAQSTGALGAMAQMLSTVIDTENANARAALAAASRGSGSSSSAAGSDNALTDFLMALGINKNQAKGVSNTVEYLTDGSFDLNSLLNYGSNLWNDFKSNFKGNSSSGPSSKSNTTSSSNWKSYTGNSFVDNIINRGLGHTQPGTKIKDDNLVSAVKKGLKNIVSKFTK